MPKSKSFFFFFFFFFFFLKKKKKKNLGGGGCFSSLLFSRACADGDCELEERRRSTILQGNGEVYKGAIRSAGVGPARDRTALPRWASTRGLLHARMFTLGFCRSPLG